MTVGGSSILENIFRTMMDPDRKGSYSTPTKIIRVYKPSPLSSHFGAVPSLLGFVYWCFFLAELYVDVAAGSSASDLGHELCHSTGAWPVRSFPCGF